jgi:hypothetical protein
MNVDICPDLQPSFYSFFSYTNLSLPKDYDWDVGVFSQQSRLGHFYVLSWCCMLLKVLRFGLLVVAPVWSSWLLFVLALVSFLSLLSVSFRHVLVVLGVKTANCDYNAMQHYILLLLLMLSLITTCFGSAQSIFHNINRLLLHEALRLTQFILWQLCEEKIIFKFV